MSTVVPFSATRAPQLDPHNLATAELFRQRGTNRVSALANCIEHLVVNHDMPEHVAEITALQAYADIESMNQVARVDINSSTSHLVVLRTEGGRPVAFTVTELLRLLDRARDEGEAKVVDRESRRPVVIEH
uniref:hypothetical protein n=1 Tax=Halomonas sp. TaxID=1486246 RepID=UPI00260F8780|nr:hypothetical protein [Halomonas sp.]